MSYNTGNNGADVSKIGMRWYLDKIQELIKDVKEDPDNWAQYYD